MHANHLLLTAMLAGASGAPVVTLAEGGGVVQAAALATIRLRDEGAMPSLGGASEWLNSMPLTTEGLRGKVVLVDFWTYSCINWLRTEPYVRAWAEKYRTQGLVVIGVHSPEFDFERDIENVRWAVKDMKVDYPVAVDARGLEAAAGKLCRL
jgi:thiol-disulfide isomerase/thioredoxin